GLGAGRGDLPGRDQVGHPAPPDQMKGADPVIPGEVFTPDGTVELAPGRDRVELTVENSGDRPIQVGSHYHFAAANPALSFDRAAARGYRLGTPARAPGRV